MRIVHLNTYNRYGGAATATRRLHYALLRSEVDSQLVVYDYTPKDRETYEIPKPPQLPFTQRMLSRLHDTVNPPSELTMLHLYRQHRTQLTTPFNISPLPNRLAVSINQLKPDIVHLHWVANFIALAELQQIEAPIVWTHQDMWAFTGGCHYHLDCLHYEQQCGTCPQLKSTIEDDLSRVVWNYKRAAYRNKNMVMVAISQWMEDKIRKSSLFGNQQVVRIPNGLNCNVYKPYPQALVRELLNLPPDRLLIVSGAEYKIDANKGFDLFEEALKHLVEMGWQDRVELALFGYEDTLHNRDIDSYGVKIHQLGYIHDDRLMAMIYSAADVMIVPSRRESFGQTASEALACGTPVVAFGATGLLDIVDHQVNGYLAHPFNPQDLARGIVWVLEDATRRQELATAARQKALMHFDSSIIAQQFVQLYESLLK